MLKRATARSSKAAAAARGDGRARQTRLSYFDRGRSAAGARRGCGKSPPQGHERPRLQAPAQAVGGRVARRRVAGQGVAGHPQGRRAGRGDGRLVGGQQGREKHLCGVPDTAQFGRENKRGETASIGASIRRGTSCCASRTRRGGTCSSGWRLMKGTMRSISTRRWRTAGGRRSSSAGPRLWGVARGAAQRPGAMWITR